MNRCLVVAFALLCSAVTGQRASAVSCDVTVVMLFDVSISVVQVMTQYVWDGSRLPSGEMNLSGPRASDDPFDFFGKPVLDTVFPKFDPADRIRVGTFGGQFRLSGVLPVRSAATMLKPVFTVSRLDRTGPSPIWDAVDKAAEVLESDQGKKAIILVTDGRPTGNHLGLAALTEHLRALRIPVHVIQIGGMRGGAGFRLVDRTGNPWVNLIAMLGRTPGEILAELAGASGGSLQMYDTSGDRGIGTLIAAAVDQIRSSAPTGNNTPG